MNCETVISDHTSACTIDTFLLQSVTSVMGSLGKSSQNVGVQSCYFNAISATNDTTLSPATVALHRHSQLTGEEATGINIGPIYVVLRT